MDGDELLVDAKKKYVDEVVEWVYETVTAGHTEDSGVVFDGGMRWLLDDVFFLLCAARRML